MATVIRPLSHQTSAIYRLLKEGEALNARQVSERLEILPQAVYRVTDKLLQLGMIEQLGGYPARFKAVPDQAAMAFYLQTVAQTFRNEFIHTQTQTQIATHSPRITLIKNRNHSLNLSNVDARNAKESIDFIVSGLEVPDETVLAFRKAATIGVPIRTIVQQRDETSKERLEKWQEIGADVRYLPKVDLRLFVFDHRIVYLLSYDPANKDRAFGVRFEYVPLALQMSAVFEQNWQRGAIL